MLNKIYLDETFEGCKSIISELKKKHKGYKTQDIDKKLLEEEKFISFEQLQEKLVLSKLTCYYCKTDMLLMYDKPREETQWTLDSINANNNKISYIGRSPDASPATGFVKRHISQQKEIIKKVFS